MAHDETKKPAFDMMSALSKKMEMELFVEWHESRMRDLHYPDIIQDELRAARHTWLLMAQKYW